VTALSLRVDAGEALEVPGRPLELDGAAFAAAHLPEHAATLGPAAVEHRLEDGIRAAHRLVDGAGARPSA